MVLGDEHFMHSHISRDGWTIFWNHTSIDSQLTESQMRFVELILKLVYRDQLLAVVSEQCITYLINREQDDLHTSQPRDVSNPLVILLLIREFSNFPLQFVDDTSCITLLNRYVLFIGFHPAHVLLLKSTQITRLIQTLVLRLILHRLQILHSRPLWPHRTYSQPITLTRGPIRLEWVGFVLDTILLLHLLQWIKELVEWIK